MLEHVFRAGMKAQFTDRRGKKITDQLRVGGYTQTDHGLIAHDDVIGLSEGSVIVTVRSLHERQASPTQGEQSGGLAEHNNNGQPCGHDEYRSQNNNNQSNGQETPQDETNSHQTISHKECERVVSQEVTLGQASTSHNNALQHNLHKPFVKTRQIGGWEFSVFRPRLADFVLSMPRGAQIMYPKDIAQVIQLGDIRAGMNVLESGAGSGAMSLNLLEAVGWRGHLTTIEMRPEFAKVSLANATVFYGRQPEWWDVREGDFDAVAPCLPAHSFDRVVLDMLDPWNRLEHVANVMAPGAFLVCYITTTTQLSRLTSSLEAQGLWANIEIVETMERRWKAQGLAIRPDHAMIGHTGFLVFARMMAPGFTALQPRTRAAKDTQTDIDSLSSDERQAQLEELTLRDISDRKLRKVLSDLDSQVSLATANRSFDTNTSDQIHAN